MKGWPGKPSGQSNDQFYPPLPSSASPLLIPKAASSRA